MRKANVECNVSDNIARIFNKRPAFIYNRQGDAFTNTDMKDLNNILNTNITYYFQSLYDWMKVNKNKYSLNGERKSVKLNYNCIKL